MNLANYWKAAAGTLGPAAGLLIAAWFFNSPHVITDAEWGAALTAAVTGGGAVAAAPKNKKKG